MKIILIEVKACVFTYKKYVDSSTLVLYMKSIQYSYILRKALKQNL